jgi:PAS domain S-box-containing protein
MITDITKQKNYELEIKNAKKEIESSQELLELAYTAASLGLWDWRPNTNELFTNDNFETMLGYEVNTFDNTTDKWINLVHPDDIDEAFRLLQEHMDMKTKLYHFSYRLKTKDGEWKWIDDIGKVAQRDQDGNVTRFIGVHIDIDEMKRLTDSLSQSNKNISDSIEYASLIQHALIPESNLFEKYFSDTLTIWHPKDIVGGDIYLFEELRTQDECLLMVIDCTGHGVPGAFVSMLVKAIERQVVAKINVDETIKVSPAWILSYFNKTMKKLLKQDNNESISNAGFDGGVLYYNKKDNIVKFAGAETPLFYVEDKELKTIKGNRHSIGYKKSDENYEFKEHIIPVKDGMQFYITTDGYLDQNGGDKGFPFGKKRFISLLEEYANKPFFNQKNLLIESLENYQSNEERNDDITVVGFKIQETTEDIKETIIKYDGVLTQEIITHTIKIIEKEIPNIGMMGKVSTTVIELLQNMMHYGKGEGSYELIKNEYNYEIRTKNIVSEEDKNKIEKKLLEIKSLDEAGIKKRYGDLRRSGENTHGKGGGIGLYEIAKLVKNIEYKFIKTNENTYSYEFKTNIVKNKN